MSRASELVGKEIRSTASASFFVVLALAIMAGVQWYEKGGALEHVQTAQAAVAGTSTIIAALPSTGQ